MRKKWRKDKVWFQVLPHYILYSPNSALFFLPKRVWTSLLSVTKTLQNVFRNSDCVPIDHYALSELYEIGLRVVKSDGHVGRNMMMMLMKREINQ
jgi:hypothetical protein